MNHTDDGYRYIMSYFIFVISARLILGGLGVSPISKGLI